MIRRLLAAPEKDLKMAATLLDMSTTQAARFAYMAAFHAAMAALVVFNGDSPKTHSGVRSEFSLLARDNTAFGKGMGRFLARSYEYKDAADYRFEAPIPREEAEDVIAAAADFVSQVKAAVARSFAAPSRDP
jgi:uncharacterized protein (UPF0332 family)